MFKVLGIYNFGKPIKLYCANTYPVWYSIIINKWREKRKWIDFSTWIQRRNLVTFKLKYSFSKQYANYIKETYDGLDEIDTCYESDIAAIDENLISSRYSFVFLADEHFCEDYINPKIFTYFKKYIVPVLLTVSKNHKWALPKNSYIDVSNFATAKHLVQYLQYLQQKSGN